MCSSYFPWTENHNSKNNVVFHMDKLCCTIGHAPGQKRGLAGLRTGSQGEEVAPYTALMPNMKL